MRRIIVMLDNVYEEILDTTPDSEEREEILSKIEHYKKIDYFLCPSLEEKFQNETLDILDINKNKIIKLLQKYEIR